ncbi:MAG: hypothetical protein FJ144_06680 [Deltaproteobacteria bacterium]|nr:hypothetical protein [Deltaproteobacteria bacterium]
MIELRTTRAGVAALAAVLAISQLSGCGACWPGSCTDSPASPTPTPTPVGSVTPTPEPTASPSAVCQVERNADDVPANLYAAVEAGCPRLVLDPDKPRADDIGSAGITGSAICEAGRITTGEGDAAESSFFFRFSCDAERPWEISAATVSAESANDIELAAMCDGVSFTKTFTQGQVLEEELWMENEEDIMAVWDAFEGACEGFATDSASYRDCARYCNGEDSLLEALNGLAEQGTDLLDGVSVAVECYLALFDSEAIGSFLETVESTDLDTDVSVLVSTSCQCIPNTAFLECLGSTTFPCFAADGSYSAECGENCWEEEGEVTTSCEE